MVRKSRSMRGTYILHRGRLGRQAADNLVCPILAGTYNADPEQQSILTTAPVMRELEREYGSIFRGAIARMRTRKREARTTNVERRPRFVSFRGGASTLVDALVRSLTADLRLNQAVRAVTGDGDGFTVTTQNDAISADAVLLTVPASAAAGFVHNLAPSAPVAIPLPTRRGRP